MALLTSLVIYRPSKLGTQTLGRFLKESRCRAGFTQDEIRARLSNLRLREGTQEQAFTVAKSTLSDFENGVRTPPPRDLVEAVACLGYATDPTGKPYTSDQLWAIACERLDPYTGQAISFEEMAIAG